MTERAFDPRIVEREPEPSIAVHIVVPMSAVDMGALFDRELPRLSSRLAELGGSIGGAPYGRYFSWGGDTADFEIGIVTAARIAGLALLGDIDHGEVGASELPGGPTAVATHWGSYGHLAETYRQLDAWVEAAGRDSRPGPWESYIDDPRTVTDPRDPRTMVCYPLAE
jgi:effector-binding domain-containing protein